MRGLAGGSFARELSDEWGKDGNLVGPVVVVVSVAHYPYRVLGRMGWIEQNLFG